MIKSYTANQYTVSKPCLPKILRKTNEGLKLLGKVGNLFRATVNIADFCKRLSDEWKIAGKLFGSVPLLIRAPFLVYSVQNNARTISKNRTRKFRPVLNFFSNIGSLMKAAAFALWSIKKIELFGKKASLCIPLYSVQKINILNGSISVCLHIESIKSSHSLFRLIYKTTNKIARAKSDAKREKLLLSAFLAIKKKGEKNFRKKLMISKRDCLESKIEEAILLLQSQKLQERKQGSEKAVVMMKILGTRARLMQQLNVAELATSIVSVSGKLVPFVSDYSIIGYCCSAVSTASYLSMRVGKTFFVNKTPLSCVLVQSFSGDFRMQKMHRE